MAHLQGSGAGGRVNKDDFMSFLNSRGSASHSNKLDSVVNNTVKEEPRVAAAPAKKVAPAPKAQSSSSGSGRVERIPMDNMRKAIARNMVQSKLTSPHVNSLSEILSLIHI